MSPITLGDVAKKAGVSKKTVSRVINNEPNVAVRTTKKVKKAISELNYVPNTFARRLSSGKSLTLGMIVGWPVYSPYTSKLIEGAFKASHNLGYSISLFSIADENDEHIVEAYLGKQVDGFILDTPASMTKTLRKSLRSMEVPYVIINPSSREDHPTASIIRINDELSAQVGTEYLIKLGHRQIGYVAAKNKIKQQQERVQGYRNALQNFGISFREELVIGDNYNPIFHVGYHCGKELIERHPEITAIFAATDDIAMGVMRAIWLKGLKIPDDLSLIGFDDNYYAAMTSPSLTTIAIPFGELANQAVQRLIERIDDPSVEPVDVILPTQLEIRDSCKPPER